MGRRVKWEGVWGDGSHCGRVWGERLLHVILVNLVTVLGRYMQCLMVLAGCYDVIIFDVDSKDGSTGMSSPPPAFVEKEVLRNTRQLLSTNGEC